MTTALLLFGTMALFLVIGVPIAFALGASVWSTIMFSPDFLVHTDIIAQRMFGGLESTSIMAIPFFVLAGNLMTKGGISRRLVEFANSIVGGVRGGMALALVLSCAFFAALSGSAPATVIAIGSMLYPEMAYFNINNYDYQDARHDAGTITGASVGDMFKSGLFIGVVIMLVLMAVVLFIAQKEQWPKSETRPTLKEFGKTFVSAIPAILLPVIILGGIYSGYLTPTESAAVAVVWALIVGLGIYKEVKWKDLPGIILDSAKGSAMILFIIATSTAFSWIFAYSGISGQLVHGITNMHLSRALFCLVVALILLVFGMFLEGIATCVLMVPILWPIAAALGVDVIHFGMIVSISNVIGTMTPPVAVNIFSAASVSKLKIGEISKGEIPFFIGYLAVFLPVVLFPELATLLV